MLVGALAISVFEDSLIGSGRPISPVPKYLYGARNDTEVRHADLKARVKHLPRDVAGQELRLLGAAIASNALSLQVYLRLRGKNNVIDDTA